MGILELYDCHSGVDCYAIIEYSSILCSRALLPGAGMDANESFVLNECATYRRQLHLSRSLECSRNEILGVEATVIAFSAVCRPDGANRSNE